jgi:hypothetical protein
MPASPSREPSIEHGADARWCKVFPAGIIITSVLLRSVAMAIGWSGTRVLVAAIAILHAGPSDAQTTRPAASSPQVPRTADRRPDLQGVWSFATLTPLERPKEFADKEVLTAEEAAAFATRQMERQNRDNRSAQARQDVEGAYNNFWWDWGTSVVGTRRTSLIVDPPDGRIPPLTREAQQRAASPNQGAVTERLVLGAVVNGPEDLGLSERCIVGFSSGPPILPSAYNNNLQIVQTPHYVVIFTEMIHEARIVPLDGRAHLPPNLRQWLGDSRGRWDGDTLIVETTNFNEKSSFSGSLTARGGSTANMRLVERFTRTADDTLLYEFTVSDPATWTRPWTVQVPMARSDSNLYEYACHEGNYSMPHMLMGARAVDQRK